jgi:hypothetical protein
MKEHKGFGVVKPAQPQQKESWCCLYLTYDQTSVGDQPAQKHNVSLSECIKAINTLVYLQEQELINQKTQEIGFAPNLSYMQKLHKDTLKNIKNRTLLHQIQRGTGWVIYHRSMKLEATADFDEKVVLDKIVLQTWLQSIQQKYGSAVEKFGYLPVPKQTDALRQFLDR